MSTRSTGATLEVPHPPPPPPPPHLTGTIPRCMQGVLVGASERFHGDHFFTDFRLGLCTDIFQSVVENFLIKIIHRSVRKLRQDPLDLSFGRFWLFLHHGIEEVQRHFLWKFKKEKENLPNVPPRLLAFRLLKNGRLRKFNRAREIEFNFLSLELSLLNLAHLFIMFMAAKYCLRFVFFE